MTWCSDSASGTLRSRQTGTVDWSTTSSTRSRTFPGLSGKYLHTAVIEGLDADTVYDFNPVNSSFIDKVKTFPTTGVKLAAISDYHVASYAGGSPMQELGDKISPLDIDGLLLNGDLVDDNGVVDTTFAGRWVSFMQAFASYFRKDGAQRPCFAVIGNHDGAGVPPTGSGAYWQGTGTPGLIKDIFSFGFAEGHPNRFADGAAWFGVGSHLLVVTVDTDHCTPLPDQRAWFAALLADKEAEFDHIEIAGHVPAFPAWSEEVYEFPTQAREFRNHFWTEMQKYSNVRHLISGHTHALQITPQLTMDYDTGLSDAANDLRFESGVGPRQLGCGPSGGVLLEQVLVGGNALVSSLDASSYIEALLHLVDSAYEVVGTITNPSNSIWHGWVIEFGAVNVTATAISRTAGDGAFYEVVDPA